MGKYINKNSNGHPLPITGKVDALVQDGAVIIEEKDAVVGDVCVVRNMTFEAAGYADSESELEVFKMPDVRRKVWLRYEHAEKVAQ